jgi:ribulose-phosphate 3-epimerase
MQIIPTSNPDPDFLKIENWLSEVKDFSTWIQIDVTDGFLVSPKSFSLELMTRLTVNLEKNIFDVHLMVKEPINWIQKCHFIQASRIIGQVEMMTDREKFISTVKDDGLEAGLAFDVGTQIDSNIPKEVDLILLMGRPMGLQSRPFDSSIIDKIKSLKDKGFTVGVDGGVDLQVFPSLVAAGVDIIYAHQYFNDLISTNDSSKSN